MQDEKTIIPAIAIPHTYKTQFENSIRFVIQAITTGEANKQYKKGIEETPKRVFDTCNYLFGGYAVDVKGLFEKSFDEGVQHYDQIVLLKDIEVFSMCEHHMLPFFGKAHVAYIPDKKLVGISKLARVVDAYARRLQIQERLTDQITSAIVEHVAPRGAACIIEAVHMCVRMRGAQKQHSVMTTSSLKGVFLEKNNHAKNELMELIK